MKVLIIGGTGLISTSITTQLLARGDEVTLYNRGKSEVRCAEGAKFIHGDRKDYAAFETQMQEADTFDVVMDMVGFVPEDAESVVRAFKGRIDHFIFCSTVCAYGGPAARYPIREDAVLMPVSTYGSNKGKCESILLEAGKRGDFPVSVMRPSQTYGEGGTIVHSMGGRTTYLDRIRRGKPIIVHGDGSCLWAACHIDDVAGGFVGAAANPKAFGKIYNVTGEEWMTWNMYHAGVARALDAPAPKLVHIPTDLLAKVAPKRFGISIDIFQWPSIFDNSAAMADLGFKYSISWQAGVKRTVKWLDDRGKVENSDSDTFEDELIAAWKEHGTEIADKFASERA
jgi:nucleoside-diphosphate-sugar epimerase